jgi:hypothetical protein
MKHPLTAEYVRGILAYLPEEGRLIWRERPDMRLCWNRRCAGKDAGSLGRGGYPQVRIDSHNYDVHRIVWLITHGVWPSELDHKDGDRKNFRLSNLRTVNRSQNSQNIRIHRDNQTGYKGVIFDKQTKRYRAHIQAQKKSMHLGCFATPQEAHAAYLRAAGILHGEFANLNREVRAIWP